MRQLLAWLFDVMTDLQRQTSSPLASLERSIAAARQAHTSARRALAVAERMSEAGFGEPAHVRACDVLARLRAAAGRQTSHLIESTSNPQ